jgi:hypothetical protein
MDMKIFVDTGLCLSGSSLRYVLINTMAAF